MLDEPTGNDFHSTSDENLISSASPGDTDQEDRSLLNSLSHSESQMIVLASEGLTDEAIAERLGIKNSKVHAYWDWVRVKFGLVSRTAIIFNYWRITRNRDEQARHYIAEPVEIAARWNPIGIFVTNTNGYPIFLNEFFLLIVGRSERLLKQESPSSLIFPLDRPDKVKWKSHCTEGRDFVGKYQITRGDGSRVWVKLHSTPYFVKGRNSGRVGALEEAVD